MKTKCLQIRVTPVFHLRLMDYCRDRDVTVSAFMLDLARREMDGEKKATGGPARATHVMPDGATTGELPVTQMSEVKAMPQSDRVALAKSLVTRPHSLGQVNKGARNTKCQHGLEFDRCEPCYEEVNGVGSYSPERKAK